MSHPTIPAGAVFLAVTSANDFLDAAIEALDRNQSPRESLDQLRKQLTAIEMLARKAIAPISEI